jgi:hypothetical protein
MDKKEIDKIIEKADVQEVVNFLKEHPKFQEYIEYELLKRCENAFNPYDEVTYDKYHKVFAEIKVYRFPWGEMKWKDAFPDLEDSFN